MNIDVLSLLNTIAIILFAIGHLFHLRITANLYERQKRIGEYYQVVNHQVGLIIEELGLQDKEDE